MAELDEAKVRLDDAIKRLRYLRRNIEIAHDCGYTGSGGNADDGSRSSKWHYYGDDVGNRRWRYVWKRTRQWLGIARFDRGDWYAELVQITTGIEALILAGPPLTADEFNKLKDLEEQGNNGPSINPLDKHASDGTGVSKAIPTADPSSGVR